MAVKAAPMFLIYTKHRVRDSDKFISLMTYSEDMLLEMLHKCEVCLVLVLFLEAKWAVLLLLLVQCEVPLFEV